MILSILEHWPRIVIGVIDSHIQRPNYIPLKFVPFCDLADEKNIPEKNPFSTEERIKMWSAGIRELNLSNKIRIISVKRPEYNVKQFTKKFSKDSYDMVFPKLKEKNTKFDSLRNELFEEMFDRKVFFVQPYFILHTSEIRQLVKKGENWSEFLLKSTLGIFNSIQGPARMRKIFALNTN